MIDPGPKGLSQSQTQQWFTNYLKTHRAHQFTINGVTYPFVRELHFASVPYPIDRKYSMLAGLFITRPGDLLFFFQAAPQYDDNDVDSRRGLRGVYRIVSLPFADSKSIKCSTGFKILGRCSKCRTRHSILSDRCLNCKKEYHKFATKSNPNYHHFVMNLKLEIEPLIVFRRAVSDERAYADMSDPGMIWIGRHDNAMGRGKGSSIRQLLPEEVTKMVRLFLTEPDQGVEFPLKIPYPNPHDAIRNENGSTAQMLEIKLRPKAGDRLADELMLNFHVSRTIDQEGSSIQRALGTSFASQDLEYFSSEFPWGYTAGTSDFVCCFAKEGVRYRIIVMEFKRDIASDEAVIQTSLYVPWVVQVLSQFANPTPSDLEVIPIFVGRRLDEETCRPRPYNYLASFNSGAKVQVQVRAPVYIEYEPNGLAKFSHKTYAIDLAYQDRSSLLATREIDWRPPRGTVTSEVERSWVARTSWADARKSAGF